MKKYQVNMSEKAFNNLGQLVSASALPLESGCDGQASYCMIINIIIINEVVFQNIAWGDYKMNDF